MLYIWNLHNIEHQLYLNKKEKIIPNINKIFSFKIELLFAISNTAIIFYINGVSSFHNGFVWLLFK